MEKVPEAFLIVHSVVPIHPSGGDRAAGAMLTMIAAAMIPEAAEHGRPNEVGLSTLAGFLGAVMFKLLE